MTARASRVRCAGLCSSVRRRRWPDCSRAPPLAAVRATCHILTIAGESYRLREKRRAGALKLSAPPPPDNRPRAST